MSWLEAVDGSIEKWEGIKCLIIGDGDTQPMKHYKKIEELALHSPCPMCYRFFAGDDSVAWIPPHNPWVCRNCIAGLYFGCVCGLLPEMSILKMLFRNMPVLLKTKAGRKAFEKDTLSEINNILTRLNELEYWVRNVRG